MRVSTNCPLCGTDLDCIVDVGEAMVTSGPSDCWYPGSEPSLDDIVGGCACRESTLVDFDRYWLEIEERALLEMSAGRD